MQQVGSCQHGDAHFNILSQYESQSFLKVCQCSALCICRPALVPVLLLIVVAGLGQVLEFMYTAKLSLSPQNLEDVLAVANFLQMQEIVNACSAYQSMATPAVSLVTLDFALGEFSLQFLLCAV